MRQIALLLFSVALVLQSGCGGSSDKSDGGDPNADGGMQDLAGTDGPITTGDMNGCVGNCTLGAKSCDGNGVRTCVTSGACTDWSAAEACSGTDVW